MPLFGPPNIEKLKAKRDVKGLIKALCYKDDKEIRLNAAKALGTIGDVCAIEPLTAMLNTIRNRTDVLIVATALEKLNWQPGHDESAARYWVAKREWDKCAEVGAPAIQPLIESLKSSNKDEREDVARVLGNFVDPRVVESLIALFRDLEFSVRLSAEKSLCKIGESAVEALSIALKDSNHYVRDCAAMVLVHVGDTRAVEPLMAALRDSGGGVRCHAAEALGKIGDARALEALIAALEDTNQHVSGAAVEALGMLGDIRAVDPLIARLKDWYQDIREKAANALEKLGWHPDMDENGALYWIAKRDWASCIQIGAPAVNPLIAVLKDEDNDICKKAAEALGNIGDARAVKPLLALLMNQRTIMFRSASAQALYKLYRSGKLGAEDSQAILDVRNEIIQKKHIDTREDTGERHSDGERGRSCHEDYAIMRHIDEYYSGIDFPL